MTNTRDRDGQKRPSREGGGDVIHVAFGEKKGRVWQGQKSGVREGLGGQEAVAASRSDTVTDLFTRREVAKLLRVSETRLRWLDRSHIVSPSGRKGQRRAYTFQDLIALRATRELLAHDVRLRDVAQAIDALRGALPRVARPLHELRIVGDGKRVVVRASDGSFEPISGQMLLDFRVDALRADVVRKLRPETSHMRAAYETYAKASALDEDPKTFDEAEALYRRAIELDPTLAIAYTNLGNIRFRRNDDQGAISLYKRAIEIDEHQPEAHYNLGYVMLEGGAPHAAVMHFDRAIEADPRFADAHFNAAMAHEQLQNTALARAHWKRYLELEPTGTWADIARQHLG